MEQTDLKKILIKDNNFKKNITNQILLNFTYLIGAVLLFFVFLGDILNTIGNFYTIFVDQKWSIIIQSIIDIIIIGFTFKIIVDVLKVLLNDNLFIEKSNKEITKENLIDFIKKDHIKIFICPIFPIILIYPFIVIVWEFFTHKLSFFNEYTLLNLEFINTIVFFPIIVLLVLYIPLRYAHHSYKNSLINKATESISKKEQNELFSVQQSNYFDLKLQKIIILILLFLILLIIKEH